MRSQEEGQVPYRGSRKHVLDWTGCSAFLTELSHLIGRPSVDFSDAVFMPRGADAPVEARLERFGPAWLESPVWNELQNWWLCHKAGATTPNWDIAVGCSIEGRPALVLVEAKANWPELGVAGKPQRVDASSRSMQNHDQIGAAIEEACVGWHAIDPGVRISRDSHYQLANRLAFTWKLASLGIPAVLLYLGFTGDVGIEDAGAQFKDDANWQQAFALYASGAVPLCLFDHRLEAGGTPLWLMSRSRPVIEVSPSRAS